MRGVEYVAARGGGLVVVQKGDASLVEELLESRAWRLIEHRLKSELARSRELNEAPNIMPDVERYLYLGHLNALKTALAVPVILIEEARSLK